MELTDEKLAELERVFQRDGDGLYVIDPRQMRALFARLRKTEAERDRLRGVVATAEAVANRKLTPVTCTTCRGSCFDHVEQAERIECITCTVARLMKAEAEVKAERAKVEKLRAVEGRTPPSIHFHVTTDVIFAAVPMARIVARLRDGAYEVTLCGEGGPIANVVVRPVRGVPLHEALSVAAGLYWSWWRWKTGGKKQGAEVTFSDADDDEMIAAANELADLTASLRMFSPETIKVATAQRNGASDA